VKPVLSYEDKVSYSRKQREPLMGFQPTTDKLQIRRAVTYETLMTYLSCMLNLYRDFTVG